MPSNGRGEDAPRPQKIYHTYLDCRAEWLGELCSVEATGLFGFPKLAYILRQKELLKYMLKSSWTYS